MYTIRKYTGTHVMFSVYTLDSYIFVAVSVVVVIVIVQAISFENVSRDVNLGETYFCNIHFYCVLKYLLK